MVPAGVIKLSGAQVSVVVGRRAFEAGAQTHLVDGSFNCGAKATCVANFCRATFDGCGYGKQLMRRVWRTNTCFSDPNILLFPSRLQMSVNV
jgi:hypothetical protein